MASRSACTRRGSTKTGEPIASCLGGWVTLSCCGSGATGGGDGSANELGDNDDDDDDDDDDGCAGASVGDSDGDEMNWGIGTAAGARHWIGAGNWQQ